MLAVGEGSGRGGGGLASSHLEGRVFVEGRQRKGRARLMMPSFFAAISAGVVPRKLLVIEDTGVISVNAGWVHNTFVASKTPAARLSSRYTSPGRYGQTPAVRRR